MNNIDRVISHYIDGGVIYHKSDTLRLSINNEIFDKGTIIGKFIDIYNHQVYGIDENDYMSNQYLILTLQNFRSHPNWSSHIKQLAHAANKNCIPVIFVPILDMGFGEPDISYNIDDLAKLLIKTAKYSQDPDIKTACCAYSQYSYYFSYNQLVGERIIHAEDVIADFIGYSNDIIYDIISMLEPCYNCLYKLTENYSYNKIQFVELHKAKWNTEEYIQLTNDIYNKIIPVKYNRLDKNSKAFERIIKFYHKEMKI